MGAQLPRLGVLALPLGCAYGPETLGSKCAAKRFSLFKLHFFEGTAKMASFSASSPSECPRSLVHKGQSI